MLVIMIPSSFPLFPDSVLSKVRGGNSLPIVDNVIAVRGGDAPADGASKGAAPPAGTSSLTASTINLAKNIIGVSHIE